MIRFIIRTFKDIFANFFLSAATIVTIAFAVLIVSTFLLFFINVEAMINGWVEDIRIMAYLKNEVSGDEISEIQFKIEATDGVKSVRFVSKEEALEQFRAQLKNQASLLDNLKKNPLPDAFEVRVMREFQSWDKMETIAVQIGTMVQVGDVEYGQQWLEKFTGLFNLFKLVSYAMAGLFFMAAVFFVANTIRLVLYSRREEIEIMQLVGASDGFIKGPIYVIGMFQGALGGALGLLGLMSAFRFLVSNIGQEFSGVRICFLPETMQVGIVIGSIVIGWLGCYLSLRRFLK